MPPRRGAQQRQTKPAMGPTRTVPTCPAGCGFTGEANAEQSPYIACGGDPARHQRTPTRKETSP